MKKLIILLMAVIFVGANSMVLAKDNPQVKTDDKKTVGVKKPLSKKPVIKKPAVKKPVSKGKGGAKDTSDTKNSPNGILNDKPSAANPKAKGATKNGVENANNPGL